MGVTIGILAWALVPVLALVARVVIVAISLRGTKPAERPAILRALATLLAPSTTPLRTRTRPAVEPGNVVDQSSTTADRDAV